MDKVQVEGAGAGRHPGQTWPAMDLGKIYRDSGFASFNIYVCQPLGCWLEVTADLQESQAVSTVLCVEEGDSEAGFCP